MGSSRLPGKVLRPLAGRSVLGRVVRAARDSGVLADLVVATSVDPVDDAVVAECARLDVPVHRGPVDDVLSRFVGALDAAPRRRRHAVHRGLPAARPGDRQPGGGGVPGGPRARLRQHLDRPDPAPGAGRGDHPGGALRTLDRLATDHHRVHVTSYAYTRPELFRVLGVTLHPDRSRAAAHPRHRAGLGAGQRGRRPLRRRQRAAGETRRLAGRAARPATLNSAVRRSSWRNREPTTDRAALRRRPRTGVGHLVRCLALARGVPARGARVAVVRHGDRVGWAAAELAARGIPAPPRSGHPRRAGRGGPPARPGRAGARLVRAGPGRGRGAARGRRAHPGHRRRRHPAARTPTSTSTRTSARTPPSAQSRRPRTHRRDPATARPGDGRRVLAGVRYALLRDAVTAARPAVPPPATPDGRPRVLAFFGGTDAVGAAPVLTRVLLGTGHPMDVDVVVGPAGDRGGADADRHRAGAVAAPRRADRRPARARRRSRPGGQRRRHLHLGAVRLGAPAALVCVVEQPGDSYRRVVAHRLAAGLGELPDLVASGAGRPGRAGRGGATLRAPLASPQRRAALAARAWATVDGHGRARVADALLARTDSHGILKP